MRSASLVDSQAAQASLPTLLVPSFVTLTTGLWMLGHVARQVVQSGGSFQMPLAWTLMAVPGVIRVAMVSTPALRSA